MLHNGPVCVEHISGVGIGQTSHLRVSDGVGLYARGLGRLVTPPRSRYVCLVSASLGSNLRRCFGLCHGTRLTALAGSPVLCAGLLL